MDGQLEYRLGRIDTKLEQNDEDHRHILDALKELQETCSGLREAYSNIRGKTSVAGGIIGALFTAILAAIGWFFYHITGK